MKCPFCQLEHTRVIDTRAIGQSIRRRRECQQCKQRFTTYERIARTNLMVIKSDGRREEFDQDKLFRGIKLACSKRPISIDTLDKLVNDIESDLYDMGQREVKSETIGEKVMEGLMGLDEVAYIRFASVYRHFADLHSLSAEIARLQERKAREQKAREQKAREQRSDPQSG